MVRAATRKKRTLDGLHKKEKNTLKTLLLVLYNIMLSRPLLGEHRQYQVRVRRTMLLTCAETFVPLLPLPWNCNGPGRYHGAGSDGM